MTGYDLTVYGTILVTAALGALGVVAGLVGLVRPQKVGLNTRKESAQMIVGGVGVVVIGPWITGFIAIMAATAIFGEPENTKVGTVSKPTATVAWPVAAPARGRDDPAILAITKTDEIKPFKISHDVTLKERVDRKRLEAIARAIWQRGYKRTFIGYWVAGLSSDGGYWASTNFEGEVVSVQIFGMTLADAHAFQARSGPAVPDGAEIFGRWKIPSKLGGDVVIYNSAGVHFVLQQIPASSEAGAPEPHRLVQRGPNGVEFRNAGGDNSFGEYWVVTPAGELQSWDKDGRIEWATGKPSAK